VKAFLDKIHGVMDWAAKIIMINMLIVISLQILMRYVFNTPLQWSEELARFSYGWFCLFGVSLVTYDRAHLRVTFLVDRFPRKIQYLLEIFALAIMLVFSILIAWSTLELPAVQGNIRAYSLGVPFYVLHLSILPGFAISALHIAYHLYLELKPDKGAPR
jgi:TRAP-type C4-dicarboxylate transport system permease small subunit